MNIGPNERSR